MYKTIVLSKIAIIQSEQKIYNNDNVLSFLFKNKKWVLLEEFKEDAANMFELLKQAEKHSRQEIDVALIRGEQYLVFIYRNKHRMKVEHFTENLLTAVYPNLKRSLSTGTSVKMLNTYVTSKLFEALQLKHLENINRLANEKQDKLPQLAKFLPILRDYQKRSILWILSREVEQDTFPALFEKLVAKDNETIAYKHLFCPLIQADPPEDIVLPPGGILADEMGLGKTVEMLALLLLNPSPEVKLNPKFELYLSNVCCKRICVEKQLFCVCNSYSLKNLIQCGKCNFWQHQTCVNFHNSEMDSEEFNTPYICPSCWHDLVEEHGLMQTKATFIISPNTIKMQWVSEIKRHIQSSLRIFLYQGVLSGKWISPRQLAEYDVVITDYNIFRKDIYYTQDNASERVTRNKPRFMKVNTPILMLNWWRVVLDEAQMVESNKTKVFSLARMIPAINRWAVTGTPIQKSLNDLQPLLEFLGFDAVCENIVWRNMVNDFVTRTDARCPTLIKFLQKCMWRTCKSQVASELDIPPQQEVVHRIEFDNLEKLFYNEQHAECQSKFLENVIKFKPKMATISPQAMNIILKPFLKIRQTCTIPVVIATSNKGHHFNSHQQKQFLKPQELNEYLKSTNEILCKSELRAMASCHNGLAALYFLQKKFDVAIKHYEIVLKLANDYNDMNITVDSLLQIHALHNAMQIKIIQSDISIQNIEAYETRYNDLEWKYLSTYAGNLATVKISYENAIEKLNTDVENNFIGNMADGLASMLSGDQLVLIQKIREECWPLFQNQENKLMLLNDIESSRTLLYVVEIWFSKLINNFKILQNSIVDLKYFCENVRTRSQVKPAIWRQIMQLVNSVYDCHLSEIRNVQKPKKSTQKENPENKNRCKMCCIRDIINTFECFLFDKILDKDTNSGLRNHSLEMHLCKLTFQFIKNKCRPLNNKMENCWLYLENLQLVCKRLMKFWIEMEYTIKAYDELNMCKMRITLTDDPDDNSIFKIMRNEIESRIMEQQGELTTAQNQFRIQMARLKYIKHLQGNDDPGPCPVCHVTEDARYAVLECGHHICFACLKTMRLYARGNQFKCSICRNVQQNEKIYYVSRIKAKDGEDEIKGHFSSKITAIVRLVLKLKRTQTFQPDSDISIDNNIVENDVKILIFSQWEPIIQAIALALKENDIKYRAQCTATTIEEFKNPNLGITCLLMPFVRGSKGLNLVEATHVFLVEPILNPGEELQAIGRVHRFGQKKETTVHRFIVNKTIEDNIYNFIISSSGSSNSVAGIQSKWEFDNISLMDFENLFSLQQNSECE